jgi:cell division protease FtsH
VIAGLEKKNKLINPHERKIVAYHESGHAIVGYFTPGADPIRKVSIIPRGMGALGYTIQTPLEDRFLLTKSELLGKIKGLLGGRAAEEIIFNEVSTGASNDIERVTRIVYDMLTVYGMSQKIPNVSHLKSNQNQFLGQEFTSVNRSEKLEQTIDDEVVEIIKDCYDQTKQLLTDKKDKLEKMAGLLLSKEVLSEEDVTSILS